MIFSEMLGHLLTTIDKTTKEAMDSASITPTDIFLTTGGLLTAAAGVCYGTPAHCPEQNSTASRRSDTRPPQGIGRPEDFSQV